MKIGLMGLMGVMGLMLAGCRLVGANPAPPTAFDQKFYDIETNLVQQLAVRTNVVWQTNVSVQTVTLTNQQNVVVPMTVTNFVPVQVPTYLTITNTVEQYIYRPNTNAATVAQIGATAGNFAFPGFGSLIGIGLTALWGLWGTLRSSKAQKTAGTLAQVIEVGRQVLQQTPQGAQAAEAWKTWMIQHQAQQGVIESVIALLPKAVDGQAAQQTAASLLQLMQQTQGTKP